MTASTVDQWLDGAPNNQRHALDALRALVLSTCPDCEESIKWSRPCYSNANGLFCYLHRSAAHVTIGFQRGASLADPDGILQGDGKQMRHVKIPNGAARNEPALIAMLKRAHSLDA